MESCSNLINCRHGSEIEYEAAGIQARSDEAYMRELRIGEMIYDFLLVTGSDAHTKDHRGNRGTGHLEKMCGSFDDLGRAL